MQLVQWTVFSPEILPHKLPLSAYAYLGLSHSWHFMEVKFTCLENVEPSFHCPKFQVPQTCIATWNPCYTVNFDCTGRYASIMVAQLLSLARKKKKGKKSSWVQSAFYSWSIPRFTLLWCWQYKILMSHQQTTECIIVSMLGLINERKLILVWRKSLQFLFFASFFFWCCCYCQCLTFGHFSC